MAEIRSNSVIYKESSNVSITDISHIGNDGNESTVSIKNIAA